MNRHHREEGGKSGRDVGLIGERQEKVSGYDTKAWHPVDKMLNGDHPTTHMGTVACAGGQMGGHHKFAHGGSVEREQMKMVDGDRDRMRGNMDKYAHAKDGGHMHHRKEMEYTEPKGSKTGATTMMKKGGRSKFAAGGVGKVRKGEY